MEKEDFLAAEYAALRSEMERRSTSRYQLLVASYTVFTAILAVQLNAGAAGYPIAYIYPFFQLLILSLWAHNFRRTMHLSEYIRERIEPHGIGWERLQKDIWDRTQDPQPSESRPSLLRRAYSSASSVELQTLLCAAIAICLGSATQLDPASPNLGFSAPAATVLIAAIAATVFSYNMILTVRACESRSDLHLKTAETMAASKGRRT